MRKILLLVGMMVLMIPAVAQEECAFILQESQEMFDAGLIEDIPRKLSDCMEHGFTGEEQLQAHKLIILAYLFDDDTEAADAAMLNFLSEFPAYQTLATDPREFTALMNTYDTRPILMVGGSLGANFSFPLATGTIGLYDYLDYGGRYVPGGSGFHGSFRIEKRLVSRFELSCEFLYNYNRFDFYLDNDTEPQPFTGEITDFSKIDYYETQNRFNFPIGVNYTFGKGVITPNAVAGVSPGILFSAIGDGYREYENTGEKRLDPVTVSGLNVLPSRRIFNMWVFAGAGIEYKVGPGKLFVDARVYINLMNQVRPGSDRFIPKLVFETFYVSDNLLLNNLAISAGYMLPLYKPKKKVQ